MNRRQFLGMFGKAAMLVAVGPTVKLLPAPAPLSDTDLALKGIASHHAATLDMSTAQAWSDLTVGLHRRSAMILDNFGLAWPVQSESPWDIPDEEFKERVLQATLGRGDYIDSSAHGGTVMWGDYL